MSQSQMPVVTRGYLHIGFHFASMPKTTELEPIFMNFSDDWVRYAGNCWLVWTKYSQAQWLEALKPQLGEHDHVLILEIKPSQPLSGWLPQWIWNWLYKVRG